MLIYLKPVTRNTNMFFIKKKKKREHTDASFVKVCVLVIDEEIPIVFNR